MSAVHVCSPCLLLEEEAGHSGDKMTRVNLSAFGLQGAEEGKATVRIWFWCCLGLLPQGMFSSLCPGHIALLCVLHPTPLRGAGNLRWYPLSPPRSHQAWEFGRERNKRWSAPPRPSPPVLWCDRSASLWRDSLFHHHPRLWISVTVDLYSEFLGPPRLPLKI